MFGPGSKNRPLRPPGVDKEQYVSDWQQAILSRVDDDPLIFEYLLTHLGQSALNGQFRTPRQIRAFMVEMVDPDLGDSVYDPACGTAGFLIDVVDRLFARYSENPQEVPIYGEDWLETRKQTLEDAQREIPNLQTYHKGAGEKIPDWSRLEASIYGTDVSRQMMRISVMNLVLHGIRHAQPEARQRAVGNGRPDRGRPPPPLSGDPVEPAVRRADPERIDSPGPADEIEDEPVCWWAPFDAIAGNDCNLAASRYKPRVAEPVPDEDPADLIRQVLAIEKEITVGLENLLREVEQ